MPPWRLESLTFRSSSRLICELCLTLPLNHLIVFWLSEDVSCLLRVLSSLPTWSVAGFCRFPTACVHTVKLKNLLRFAVVGTSGVGSVLQPPAQGDSGYQTSLRPTPFAGSSLRRLSHLNSSSDQCKETHH
ncbi:hypothetical protein Rs2_46582 [Raphanus sativus]|nr:hypothetical protein Rs2_48034 [Raphanus sativus]KAJ4870837.1 hypothetical protein Rs2_47555 [Raphanus sativus]KAJ4871777.1 hypothetical protein Rs2_46582 [Raphanus sativus]